jgi:hypothetical protein
MTTEATATPAELVRGYEAQIRDLETKAARLNEQLSGETVPGKTDYNKRRAVQDELADIENKITLRRDELAEAQAAATEEQRAAQQRENEIHNAHFERRRLEDPSYRNRFTIERWALEVHRNRAEHIRLGVDDPGDIPLSAQATWAPIAERDRLSYEATRQMFERERATPAQVAASEQRSALVEKHYQEYGLECAERIAGLVVDDGLSEEVAIAQTADNEANLEADFDEWEQTDDENEPAYATTEAE